MPDITSPTPINTSPLTQNAATLATPPPGPNRRNTIILTIIIAVLVLTTAISLITSLILLRNQKNVPSYQPLAPTEQVVKPAPLPSKFATDSAILQINSNLKALMSKIDSVDLFEPEITPPNLDLRLNIAPQQ